MKVSFISEFGVENKKAWCGTNGIKLKKTNTIG